jgi:hypothetical protein
MEPKLKIVTIGVYGYDNERFFSRGRVGTDLSRPYAAPTSDYLLITT